MKRYFLNKINKISNTLNKSHIRHKPMLIVDYYQDYICAFAFIENEIIKKLFKNENKLNKFIKDNDIDFIVYGVNLDLI